MKAVEAKLLDFLKKSPQFIIPIYQRTYSWSDKECRQLWDDIIRCGSDDGVSVHFIGSIVYIESGLSQVVLQSPLLVIDGQQRLTTVSLVLAALAEAVGDEEPYEGFSKRKIKNHYLLNPEEEGERHYKLLLSQTDKDTLTALVEDGEAPRVPSLRIKQNYELFKSLIAGSGVDLVTICKGLAKLVVVDIALTRDQDNPQLIFESMNSTGKELSQADLIRNYVLMGLEPKLQARLYQEYWRPMELDFGQEAYGTHFDAFIRHYLIVKTGQIPKIKAVYEAFKEYAIKCRKDFNTDDEHIEALVRDVRGYTKYFCAIALGLESDTELKKAFQDIRELKVDVSYPFLLELYHDYVTDVLTKEDFLTCARLIESYVFRRAICDLETNSLNKTFATFTKVLKKDRYLDSVKAHFSSMPSYRRFPSNKEFKQKILTHDLYNFRSRSYWLRKIENFGRKELVNVNEFTIEHIMPQNENLIPAWRVSLGENWETVQQTWLHTLGNLTLTAYNSEYSDHAFADKRDMLHAPDKGLKHSPLKLNQGLGQLEDWNEVTIKERAQRLANKAQEVWAEPDIDPELLEDFKPKKESRVTYTIEDHQYLANGSGMYGDMARLGCSLKIVYNVKITP